MFSIPLNRFFNGIRFRLTLVYSILFGLFICLFAFILSKQLLHTLEADFDAALLNYAIDITKQIEVGNKGYETRIRPSAIALKKQFPFILQDTYYFLRSIDGQVLNQSHNALHFSSIPYDQDLATQNIYTHRYLDLIHGHEHYRALNLKIHNDAGEIMVLQVATNSELLKNQENRIVIINLTTIPLLILISGWISFLIASKALSPIKLLTETTNNIMAKNLSLRVPVLQTGDEVEELSKTLNHLLERLEKAFKSQENFVADAGHQLNTPLAIIKGELDVLESRERSLSDHQKFQKSLREEISRLIELVKNLLLISRVESGESTFNMRPVRLDEVLLGISSRLSAAAKIKKMPLRFNIGEEISGPEKCTVSGEKQLLDSLFENLLVNALNYSPEGSTVSIELLNKSGMPEVHIKDEGPGIPSQTLTTILSRRFQRGSGLPGSGIGLSIAYKIAEHHQAQISYHELQPQGSLFIVSFLK